MIDNTSDSPLKPLAAAYDCVVLGGGPAGSTVAALTAEAGYATLLVEREKVPRFHVGESLMPETYWTLQRLGVLDQLKASAYPKKYSVQFVNHEGKASRPFYFHKHDDRECSQTWQVWRSEFDKILFDNAASKGADCRDQTRVTEVLFDDADTPAARRARAVRLQLADGNSHEVAARVVIDATGQQSIVANRLGIRRENPQLRKASVWTYYRDAWRDPGIDEGATIIFQTEDQDSWFWFIPLPKNITSIGVVGDVDYLLKGRGKPEVVLEEELAKCPALAQRLKEAERADDFHAAREFSYKSEVPAGNGWVLVGDAYGFIDPIYSSGVFFALKSGELAADCINTALAENDTSAQRLSNWVPDFEAGIDRVRKLVDAYYTREFSFGQFARRHPEHIPGLTDLLIGRIFHDSAGDIFNEMDPMLAAARAGEEE